MSQLAVIGRNVAPRRVVFLNSLRILRSLVEIASAGRNRVERLRHAPPASRHDHRVLHDVAGFEIDISAFFVFSFAIACDTLKEWYARAFSIANANAR